MLIKYNSCFNLGRRARSSNRIFTRISFNILLKGIIARSYNTLEGVAMGVPCFESTIFRFKGLIQAAAIQLIPHWQSITEIIPGGQSSVYTSRTQVKEGFNNRHMANNITDTSKIDRIIYVYMEFLFLKLSI